MMDVGVKNRKVDSLRWLQSFANLHVGRRCFIAGNGPSLAKCDLTRLQDEWFFAVNRGYLAYELGLPKIPYLVVSDPQTYNRYAQEIRGAYASVRFYRADVVACRAYRYAVNVEAVIELPFHRSPCMDEGYFALDVRRGVYRGHTVVLDVAVQLAFYMGFCEVYLIGCDYDYQGQNTHFYGTGGYEASRRNDMPMEKVFKAFRTARLVFETNGRVLANATKGGALKELPRVDYDSLFEKPTVQTSAGRM